MDVQRIGIGNIEIHYTGEPYNAGNIYVGGYPALPPDKADTPIDSMRMPYLYADPRVLATHVSGQTPDAMAAASIAFFGHDDLDLSPGFLQNLQALYEGYATRLQLGERIGTEVTIMCVLELAKEAKSKGLGPEEEERAFYDLVAARVAQSVAVTPRAAADGPSTPSAL